MIPVVEHDDPSSTNISGHSAGDVLCDRFRIVRFLARGGVGEVYEAEDLTLRTRVALKMLRPEVAHEPTLVERFRREILLARRVTHVNVCRVFDVYDHHPRGRAGSIFVTMELLGGQNLGEAIRAAVRLTPAEALPLVTQMAAGLGAAHAAGIVHRDFKSSNVMLVTEPEAAYAVITDFGLAHSFQLPEESLTGTGGFLGTPAYMAPEQVEGSEVTKAADIYALGVVMYEMTTGRRPFGGSSPLAIALSRLKDAPPSPREWVPDLDPRWEAVILACLERYPARRPARVEDVPAALRGSPPRLARRRGATPRAWARLGTFGAVGVFAVLGTAFLLPRLAPNAGANAPAASTTYSRRSVAVLGFRNLSLRPDTEWFSTALSEALGTELAAGDRLRAISGEEIARMKMEMPLGAVDTLGPGTLGRVRRRLGADLVVLGSYLHLGPDAGGRIRIDLRVQEAATGETLASITEMGSEDQVFDLLSRTGASLRQRIGVGAGAVVDAVAVQEQWAPSSPHALRLYAEGVSRLRLLDAQGARSLLEAAVDADDTYLPARVALSETWSALGYERKAFEEARHAFERRHAAARDQQLLVEGRYHEARQDWNQAIAAYKALWQLFPDRMDNGLRLAATQTAASHARDALATLAELRALQGSTLDDPRIDLEASEADRALSDLRRMQASAQAAARKGRALEAPFVIAKAMVQEGRALQLLGRTTDAVARFEEARQIYDRIGDIGNRAWTAVYLGMARWSTGDPVAAEAIFRETLGSFQAVANKRGVAVALNLLALTARKQGRLAEASRLQDESLATFREIDDRAGAARVLNNRAVICRDEGRLAEAAGLYGEALALGREAGTRRDVAAMLAGLGDIHRERGELDEAARHYLEALAINEAIELRTQAASDRYRLGALARLRGDLAEARRQHTVALALREEMKEALAVAESRLALAELSIDDGRAADAEAPALAAAALFGKTKAVNDEAAAYAVAARARLVTGRIAEAGEAIRRAASHARKSQAQRVRISVSVLEAQVRAASDEARDVEKATRALRALATEARASGRLELEYDARLAAAEVGLTTDRARSVAALEALENETARRGFGLFARRAAAARRSAGSVVAATGH